VPEDAEFTNDGTTAFISLYTETRADLQGKKFMVRTSWKKPGIEAEYVYLNMHSKKHPGHYMWPVGNCPVQCHDLQGRIV